MSEGTWYALAIRWPRNYGKNDASLFKIRLADHVKDIEESLDNAIDDFERDHPGETLTQPYTYLLDEIIPIEYLAKHGILEIGFFPEFVNNDLKCFVIDEEFQGCL